MNKFQKAVSDRDKRKIDEMVQDVLDKSNVCQTANEELQNVTAKLVIWLAENRKDGSDGQ